VHARVFWLISRVAIFLYRHFPVFGPIPGSIAIIRRDGGFLVVKRNDGFGFGFPGGIAMPWESAEQALRREVLEETGLKIASVELRFEFNDSSLYPARTTVFEAAVEGNLRNSWEGTVAIVTLSELEPGVIRSQRPVVEYLKHLD
jgi:8-oxo-dGTP pyrophosphatase MutT (NUDIX family)